jgi:hypothetical protein
MYKSINEELTTLLQYNKNNPHFPILYVHADADLHGAIDEISSAVFYECTYRNELQSPTTIFMPISLAANFYY